METLTILFTFLPLLLLYISPASTQTHFLNIGFKAFPNDSTSLFQPLLSDPTAIFSFGFLKEVNSVNFALAVIHLPSSQPVWRTATSGPVHSSLSFNGSLVFSSETTGVIWSSGGGGGGGGGGNRVVLLNSSNLQIIKHDPKSSVVWQSFDFPSNTIVQNQNFTSKATLFSPNSKYSLRLGSNYLALFMEFGPAVQNVIYWKRTAMQAKNQIIDGGGPLFARLEKQGFLGLYQTENAAVDVIPFDSFGRGIDGFRRLTLEDDGNLNGYYWNGTVWDSDYVAITELCELPSPCGAYGVCRSAEPRCGCLDNRTDGCFPAESGDLCGKGEGFTAVRTNGVDLGNKEFLGFVKVGNYLECEELCERNCGCWGAVYYNGSGNCYAVNYPVQTVVAVGDEGKKGYFKVRRVGDDGGAKRRRTAKVLLIVGVVVAAVGVGVGVYRVRLRRRRGTLDGSMGEGISTGPYKDLNSGSFRSIEMVDSFRK